MKDIPCTWIGRFNIVSLKVIHTDIMQSLSNSNDFFCRNTKIYHKIHMGCQETPNSQINLKNEEQN